MQPDIQKAWDTATPLTKNQAINHQAETEGVFDELAVLSPVEYDRQRKQAAKELGIRETTLDDEIKKRRPKEKTDSRGGGALKLPTHEPWPDPVDGNALANELATAFSRYLALEDGAATAMALWVVHTHAFDAAHITPRLAITSPEKRCGKTTALMVLSSLVAKPLPASNISAAALFRTTELKQPTILVDEADTFLKGNEELRGILNAGHNRGGQVIRLVGDAHEPQTFNTFAPVSIAMIGRLPDTLEDRSIVIKMRRKRPNEQVVKFRLGRTPDLDAIGRKVARWAADNLPALKDADPITPKELHDRAADNWTALLAIADLIGGAWPEQARRAALTLSAGDDADSIRATLLIDIQALFKENSTDRMTSTAICDALALMEDKPWPEWGRSGKPMTTRALAKQLSGFEIKPKTIRFESAGIAKGYLLEDFTDAFSRYSPSLSVTPLQVNETGAYRGNLSVTQEGNVTDRNPQKPAEIRQCYGVTDRNPQNGQDWEERAAILEFDGGFDREEAEQKASAE